MESVCAEDLTVVREKFLRELRFIDSLAAMGEEDYEIESNVVATSRTAAKLLAHRLESVSPQLPPSLVGCEVTAEAMFRWVYQVNLSRRSSIKRLSDKSLEGFFVQLIDEMGLTHAAEKEFVFFVHAQLLIAIDQAGAQVNSALRERQIRRCMKKLCGMAPARLAVN